MSTLVKSKQLTIANKLGSHLVVLLHQPQVESRAITHLIISIIKTSGQEHVDAALNLGVFLTNAELRQSRDRSSAHYRVLQHHTVVDIADILRRLCSPRSLETKQMQDPDRKLGKLAVLNELAKMCKCLLLALRKELDEVEHALHNAALELVAALIA